LRWNQLEAGAKEQGQVQGGEGSYLLVESAKIGCTELLKNLEKSREREQSDH